MTVRFGPIDQRTTPESVHRVLRDAILNGTIPPGGQLREEHIANDMGISRSPLREALTKLEEEGLVVKVPFRGAFVAEVSAELLADIAAVRYHVEPFAAELAEEALRGSERKRLMETIRALHRATRANDIAASIDAHMQFHRLFYECSNNSVLLGLWNGWESKLRLFLTADHQSYSDLEEIATEHERLADMVLAGDMEEFRHELGHHIHSAPGASIEDQGSVPVTPPSQAQAH